MIFPTTYLGGLLLLIVSLLCLGIWASLHRLTFKWRFELLYYDLCFGLALVALVAAFTFGSMNSSELTFQDNLLLTGLRKEAWATLAGGVFSLGAILLLAASVVSRISVSFLIAYGLSLIIGAGIDFSTTNSGSSVLMFSGATLLLMTVVLMGVGYSWHTIDLRVKDQKAFIADPRSKFAAPKRVGVVAALFLAVISGIVMGGAAPMLSEALSGENGISAYGGFLFFAAGFFVASQLYIPFFMNFPVQGEPIQLRHYFKGTQKSHLVGLTAGILLGIGILARMVAEGVTPSVRVSPILGYVLTGAPAALAAIFGLLLWREFKGASYRVQMMMVAGIILFLAGIAVVAVGRVSS